MNRRKRGATQTTRQRREAQRELTRPSGEASCEQHAAVWSSAASVRGSLSRGRLERLEELEHIDPADVDGREGRAGDYGRVEACRRPAHGSSVQLDIKEQREEHRD